MAQEIEISLEETNRLRASLGLKPIVAETVRDTPSAVPSLPTAQQAQPKRVVKSAKPDELFDDTDDWLAGLGNTKKTSPVVEPDHQNTTELQEEEQEGIKVVHSLNEIGKLQDGSVLTLKDDDLEAEDQLEADTLVLSKKLKDDLKLKRGQNRFEMEEDDEKEDHEEGFVLNGAEIIISNQLEPPLDKKRKKIALFESDDDELVLDNDYKDSKPVKMKKLKNLSKTHKRARTEEKDKELTYVPLSKDEDIQDDELESILSALRKTKLKSKANLNPELYIKKEIKEEAVEPASSGLVIDEMTNFLSNIKKEEEEQIPVKVEPKQEPTTVVVPLVKEESTEEEFGSGLGAALKLLQKRNDLSTVDAAKKEQQLKQRELIRQRELIALQDLDELTKKSEQARLLQDYNPSVNLKYFDDDGNELSTKEAFKHMSHQFHGHLPSHSKKEKFSKKHQQK